MLGTKHQERRMATDHRIISNGQRLDFTCENRRYQTDINKGKPHGSGFSSPSYSSS
jgi:hypothetical protein